MEDTVSVSSEIADVLHVQVFQLYEASVSYPPCDLTNSENMNVLVGVPQV